MTRPQRAVRAKHFIVFQNAAPDGTAENRNFRNLAGG